MKSYSILYSRGARPDWDAFELYGGENSHGFRQADSLAVPSRRAFLIRGSYKSVLLQRAVHKLFHTLCPKNSGGFRGC